MKSLIIKGSIGSQYKSDEIGTCPCREVSRRAAGKGFSKVHIPLEPVPGRGGIGSAASLGHMDADRGEMDRVENIINYWCPLKPEQCDQN